MSVSTQNSQQTLAKSAITFAVMFVVLMQCYAGFRRVVCGQSIPLICELPKDPNLYPFLNYGMYSRTKKEGVAVAQYHLMAVFADGSEKRLMPEDLGTTDYWFHGMILRSLAGKDDSKIGPFIQAYEAAGNPSFVTLRLDNNPLVVTREGIDEPPTEMVYSLSIESLNLESLNLQEK
ncbi:MAG: hypothetical protein AAFV90_21180 [Cyanobacteria bacterium J06634_5]